MKNEIIKANAEYTGGGIYRFTAELSDSRYLIGCTEWKVVYLVDEDPDATEESWYNEWFDSHTIKEIKGEEYSETIKNLLTWILENKPSGNYSAAEIETILKKENEAMNGKTEELINKLVDFQEAYINLIDALEDVDSDVIWNKEITDLYPFEKPLEEYTISIIDWVMEIKEKLGY